MSQATFVVSPAIHYKPSVLSTPFHAAKLTNKQADILVWVYWEPGESTKRWWPTAELVEGLRDLAEDDWASGIPPSYSVSHAATYGSLMNMLARGFLMRNNRGEWACSEHGKWTVDALGLL